MGFDSLFTGISGLNAYQSEIDMISNNIANVGTVGFKGQDMTFADMYYQSLGYATAPTQTLGGVDPQQVGIGVKVSSVSTDFSQGGLETTGVATDMAINGDGFFILNNVNGTGAPVYTRDGHFSLNSSGVLYDPATGMAVQGYMAASNGTVTPSGAPGTITLPIGLSMQSAATGGANAVKYGPSGDAEFDVQYAGSLDQAQYSAEAATPGSGQSQTISTTIYDSLGNPHEATVTFSPVGPNTPPATAMPATVNNASGTAVAPATRWKYSITFADGTTPTATASSGYLFFDGSGNFINTSSSATGTPVHAAGSAASGTDGNLLGIPAAGGWPGGDNAAAANIGLDFSSMHSLSGSATATTLNQNGYPAGTLSNISVGQDGTVTGAFTNGQQKTLAQVALATFQNENGLQRTGSNGYVPTANSGLAQVGTASSGRFGAIIAGSLEQSNVSVADQFTKMIVAQRAFEANTRGITTADQNLQTVINMRATEN